MRLADRTALITGSALGIGRAMATLFAAEGARVVVADRLGDVAEEVAAGLRAAGGQALAVTCDVTSAADVDDVVAQAEEAFEGVDVLVNNAYSCVGDSVVRMDEATWETDVRGTLTSAFLCSKRVLPGMVESGRGAIVSIASVNGLAYFGNEAYSAAKAGLISLTESIAVRYGSHGVRANAIAPGSIRSQAWEQRLEQEPDVLDRLVRWYPLGRIGTPEDVARAALFLASDEASWITGVCLRVDGGLLAGNKTMVDELLVESRGEEL
jgi:NAD(P)-dependent dehydrogenase (short-subunit alcohol dehydrogenase family)